jgi:hypothetical protein
VGHPFLIYAHKQIRIARLMDSSTNIYFNTKTVALQVIEVSGISTDTRIQHYLHNWIGSSKRVSYEFASAETIPSATGRSAKIIIILVAV